MIPDTPEMRYETWIVQLKNTDKLSEQLVFILTILNSLEGSIQKDFQDQILKFESYYKNQKLMRHIKHRDALISEYPTEYYGHDYGEDDPFLYKKDVELQITKISLEIMSTLGMVIKRLKNTEFNIDDEV